MTKENDGAEADRTKEEATETPDKVEAIIETFNGFGEDRLGVKGYREGRSRPAKPPEARSKRGDDTI